MPDPIDSTNTDHQDNNSPQITNIHFTPPPSRLVIIGWSFWLLITWWLTIGAGHSHAAIRAMLFTSLTGMMLLWPAWRLAQDDPAAELNPRFSVAPADVFVEWFSMALLFQAVLIPLRMTAKWTLTQALWLDAAFLAWTMLAAAIVAWGCHPKSPIHRTIAMALCAILLLGEPALLALANTLSIAPNQWQLALSPIQITWNLSVPHDAWLNKPPTIHVMATTATALAAWIFTNKSRSERLRPKPPTQSIPHDNNITPQ